MTREEAINTLGNFKRYISGGGVTDLKANEALDMAIEALQTDIVRCENCKHQDECEEVVLFEVTDDEVIGHRVHWCSYGKKSK